MLKGLWDKLGEYLLVYASVHFVSFVLVRLIRRARERYRKQTPE